MQSLTKNIHHTHLMCVYYITIFHTGLITRKVFLKFLSRYLFIRVGVHVCDSVCVLRMRLIVCPRLA